MTWRRDPDLWLYRPVQPGDAAAVAGADCHAFIKRGMTYCRSMGQAEAIDRGEKLTNLTAPTLAQDRHGYHFNPSQA